jgi:hypothetical protein
LTLSSKLGAGTECENRAISILGLTPPVRLRRLSLSPGVSSSFKLDGKNSSNSSSSATADSPWICPGIPLNPGFHDPPSLILLNPALSLNDAGPPNFGVSRSTLYAMNSDLDPGALNGDVPSPTPESNCLEFGDVPGENPPFAALAPAPDITVVISRALILNPAERGGDPIGPYPKSLDTFLPIRWPPFRLENGNGEGFRGGSPFWFAFIFAFVFMPMFIVMLIFPACGGGVGVAA